MDFLDPTSISAAATQIIEKIPIIDRLIMVGGVLKDNETQPEKRLSDIDSSALHYSYQINAIGPILLVKSLWQVLRQPRPLVVASLSARVGSLLITSSEGWYGYRAVKPHSTSCRTAAIELARYNPGSCMVTLHPGTVDTDLSRPFQKMATRTSIFSADQSVKIMAGHGPIKSAQTGGFFARDGSSIPF